MFPPHAFTPDDDSEWLPPQLVHHVSRVPRPSSVWTWGKISQICSSKTNAILWEIATGLLHGSRSCPNHRKPMNFAVNRGAFGEYRCPRRRSARRPGEEVSAARGTWFGNHRLPLATIMQLMYSWTQDLSYAEIRNQCSREGEVFHLKR